MKWNWKWWNQIKSKTILGICEEKTAVVLYFRISRPGFEIPYFDQFSLCFCGKQKNYKA